MLKVIALVVGLAGMQFVPVVDVNVPAADLPTSNHQGQPGDSVSAPALRIVRVIEVTDGTTEYMQPIWSPDGTKLAFTKPGFKGIYVRNADGSGPIREFGSAGNLHCLLLWTPDSKALLCREGGYLGRIDVETAEVDTLAGPLTEGEPPHRNAYGDVTFTVRRQMQSLDFKTGSMKSTPYAEVEFLDPKTGSVERACDYYSEERPLSGDIWLKVDFQANRVWIVEGSGVRRMEFPYRVLLATLSPTRDRVSFLQSDDNMHVSRLDGSGKVSLGPGSSWDWSADGKRLVYTVEKDNGLTTTASELFVANSDGSGVTQLTSTPDIIEKFPRWSPDGMRIAYSTDNTGKIYVAVLEEVK